MNYVTGTWFLTLITSCCCDGCNRHNNNNNNKSRKLEQGEEEAGVGLLSRCRRCASTADNNQRDVIIECLLLLLLHWKPPLQQQQQQLRVKGHEIMRHIGKIDFFLLKRFYCCQTWLSSRRLQNTLSIIYIFVFSLLLPSHNLFSFDDSWFTNYWLIKIDVKLKEKRIITKQK